MNWQRSALPGYPREDLAAVNQALAETKTALESRTLAIASGKEDLARVYAEKEKAEALAQSLSSSLKEFRDQLEQEEYRPGYRSRMNATDPAARPGAGRSGGLSKSGPPLHRAGLRSNR